MLLIPIPFHSQFKSYSHSRGITISIGNPIPMVNWSSLILIMYWVFVILIWTELCAYEQEAYS